MSTEGNHRDEDWLRVRWFSDTPVTAIAEESGCSDTTVHRHAKKFGFPPKHRVTTHAPYRDEEWLRERWFSTDQTNEEIAVEAGCDRLTIERWASRFGFPPRTSTRPWRDPETVRELYVDNGLTLKETAEELGCSSGPVSQVLESHGIERRESWRHLEKHGVSTRRRSGHEQVSFTVDGQTHYYAVHKLVAIAEFGLDAVAGKIVHHKNGIPWDNRPSNLELLDDQSEHAKLHNAERDRDEYGRYV